MNNQEYEKTLAKIEKIRTTIKDGNDINLPQITVIGDQSSGKSSLLSEISGIPFPTNSGITTKCPIVVYTKHSKEPIEKFMINDEEIDKDILPDKILELQKSYLSNNMKVSKTPIKIVAESHTLKELVLVDLPGIISNGDGKVEVIEMIEEYIKPEQSLILIVTEAKQDHENAQALELAYKFDPTGERSIRIMTKYDVFDSVASKKRADKIINEIENLSPHAVVCNPNGEKYNESSEKNILSHLPNERVGIASLTSRLPNLLCKLIETNLPNLEEQLLNILQKNRNSLEEIGKKDPQSSEILLYCQTNLQKQIKCIESNLSIPLIAFQKNMMNTKKDINEQLINKHFKYNVFICAFFQGEETFNKCLEEINSNWKSILNELFDEIDLILYELLNFDELNTVSYYMKKAIMNDWNSYREDLFNNFKTISLKELNKEKIYKTMNHYLTSKYKEELILPESVIEKICENISYDTFSINRKEGRQLYSLSSIRENILKIIKEEVENNINDFEHSSLEEQHKQRILAAVLANWSVSQKNLIDNILSSVTEDIITKIYHWIDNLFLQNETIKKNSLEDNTIKKKRTEYIKNIKMYEDSLCILREI